MLTFPKYQPIWFNKPPICGKCDIVTIGDNKDFSFVYNANYIDTDTITVGTFDTGVGTSVGTGIWILTNMVWNSTTKKVDYNHANLNAIMQWNHSVTPILATGKYNFKFQYNTISPNWTAHIEVFNIGLGINIVDETISLKASAYAIDEIFYFDINPIVGFDNQLTYKLTFTTTDLDDNLSIDNIFVQKQCDISEVKLISDNGLDFTLLLESSPYLTLTPINDISVLFNLEIVEIITLLEDADFDWRKNCIRFQITDCDNNVYYSNYFNFHDSNTPACLDTKTRLTWYNKCSFNGIDYSNGNMFEIYVKGFPRRLSIDKSDRNVFISSEGKHSLAYDFSYVRYELKIVGYTELLHEVIEKAVLHSHFYINGERYMIDSDSKYEFGRNINARMTATIELIKDGSELLILDCCN